MPTPKSYAQLAALWVTGYTPSQTDFENLFSSFENIVDGNLLTGNDSAITAVYPASQGTAYALTKKVNNIQVSATGISGVKLPQAKAGMICFVFDNGSNGIKVYPFLGDGISALATNIPVTLLPQQGAMFVCNTNGIWVAYFSTIANYNYGVYVAYVRQAGTAAPVATVIENTLGATPVWAWSATGFFTLISTGLFTTNKTVVEVSCDANNADNFIISPDIDSGAPDEIDFFSLNHLGVAVNNASFSIIIRVYP